jgi:hypothetical protein
MPALATPELQQGRCLEQAPCTPSLTIPAASAAPAARQRPSPSPATAASSAALAGTTTVASATPAPRPPTSHYLTALAIIGVTCLPTGSSCSTLTDTVSTFPQALWAWLRGIYYTPNVSDVRASARAQHLSHLLLICSRVDGRGSPT